MTAQAAAATVYDSGLEVFGVCGTHLSEYVEVCCDALHPCSGCASQVCASCYVALSFCSSCQDSYCVNVACARSVYVAGYYSGFDCSVRSVGIERRVCGNGAAGYAGSCMSDSNSEGDHGHDGSTDEERDGRQRCCCVRSGDLQTRERYVFGNVVVWMNDNNENACAYLWKILLRSPMCQAVEQQATLRIRPRGTDDLVAGYVQGPACVIQWLKEEFIRLKSGEKSRENGLAKTLEVIPFGTLVVHVNATSACAKDKREWRTAQNEFCTSVKDVLGDSGWSYFKMQHSLSSSSPRKDSHSGGKSKWKSRMCFLFLHVYSEEHALGLIGALPGLMEAWEAQPGRAADNVSVEWGRRDSWQKVPPESCRVELERLCEFRRGGLAG